MAAEMAAEWGCEILFEEVVAPLAVRKPSGSPASARAARQPVRHRQCFILMGAVRSRSLLILAQLAASTAAALTTPGRLVLLRHGESAWNAAGRFTGW